jgi:hypothetical protein
VDDHRLLNSQRNEIFTKIQTAGFDPATFKWENRPGLSDMFQTVPYLVHVPSDYSFQFDLLKGGEWCRYSPGENKFIDEQYPGTRPGLLSYFTYWLQYLKREIEAPDLWSAISGETRLVFGTSVTDSSTNTFFSIPERERISRSLGEIRAYLVATSLLTEIRLKFIEERLHYLEDAAGRMGRSDWMNLALSTLVNIVVGVALAPEKVKELLRLAGSALAWVLGGTPILPHSAQ